MTSSRMMQMPLTLAFTLCLYLVVACTPASALVEHELLGTFHPVPESSFLITDAVDNSGGASNGDLYVGEFSFEAGSTIEKFDEAGVATGTRITGSDTPAGSFAFLSLSSFFNSGIAVDSSSGANKGDLYVADIEHDVIDKFDESGHYLCQITGSDTPSPSECNGVAGSDTPAESISPTGLAIDSSGNLYAGDPQHGVIDKFGPSGQYISQIADPNITLPGAIALDSHGDVYVANAQLFQGVTNVVEFNAKGEFVAVLDANGPFSVSVDLANDHVYTSDTSPQTQIAEYDSSGNLFAPFGPGPEHSVLALAGNDTTGNIYATTQSLAYIFGPAVVVPVVTTGSASDVQQTSATLEGEVEPDLTHGGGEVTSCQFEYGTTVAYGQTAPCLPTVPYSSTTSISANVGLAASTAYHYRLSATDSGGTSKGGTSHGEDHTLVTFGPPGVDSESSSDAVIASATVHAQINPYGYDTTCQMQYVDEADFNASGYANAATLPCGPPDIGSGFGDKNVEVILNGLQIATTYHYRFLATNLAGTTDGVDHTFATFGISSFSLGAFDRAAAPYTQAGGHPYSLTTSFSLNTTDISHGRPSSTDANPKDVFTELPPGLIGNPEATPKCASYNVAHADCSGASQVGILKVFTAGGVETESPIYNLVPPKGIAAQFGARFNGFVTAHINAKLRTGGDYGVTADSLYLSADEGLVGATVTFWGVPAEPAHDGERYCPAIDKINEEAPCHERASLVPFLSNPTSCLGRRTTTLRVDSWHEPGVFVDASAEMPATTGCEKLDFTPKFASEPGSHSTDSPSGLKVELHIPQNENPVGLAEANLRDARVTLPEGMTVNPSLAGGLQSCSLAQIAMKDPEPAECPDSSKIGSVEVESPLVDHPLVGSVYVAAEHQNPFGSLFAIYMAINDPRTGVVIKLAGKVTLDRTTGQLTTTFDENPQLPFENLKIELFGGERAPLATPMTCGSYPTQADLLPWSAPESAEPTSLLSAFQLSSAAHGGPCAAPLFAPSLTAGTESNAAGSFAPFTTTLMRGDGEQRLATVSIQMPPGLLGVLAGIPLCEEALANEGACPAASKIGHVTVAAGVGSEPVTLPQSGKPQDPVYLTGPYAGAPFGLSIVVPAEAGPFDLDENGKPVVVRAKIEVDPHTAQVSVISDPLPSILQGVPTDVRAVNVVIDRERFTFNSTSCRALRVAGTMTSTQGASANASSRYQTAGCNALAYKPKFSVSATDRFTRANGVGLTLKVAPPAGQANTAKVKLVFPKQLPARVSTLKLACPARIFDVNPAGCPAGSVIGNAIVHTPILSNQLRGPIYLVSFGNAAFPNAEIVLQGEGVKLIMDGKTNIQKGITSSTFQSVPDAPFTTFEARLPAGPHSAFAVAIHGKRNGSLCGQNLNIANIFVGQNALQLKQTTKIAVSGCSKHKKKKKKKIARSK